MEIIFGSWLFGPSYGNFLIPRNIVRAFDTTGLYASGGVIHYTRDEHGLRGNYNKLADIDFLTIGQYLQPAPRHAPIARFVTPDEFDEYRRLALTKGFLLVSASPLTRSSYHADSDFETLRKARLETGS